MRNNDVETLEHKGLRIRIQYDDSPESPREWSNLGTLVCFHRRYDLGDKHGFQDGDEVLAHIKETKAIALEVFLYDHSGLSMSTGAFSCPWDSGQVGVIFIEREKILKEYRCKIVTKKIRETVLKRLKQEVETYSEFLEGRVYGFIVETETGETLDSCWGFYGLEYCIEEAKSSADHYAAKEAEAKAFAASYGMAGGQ